MYAIASFDLKQQSTRLKREANVCGFVFTLFFTINYLGLRGKIFYKTFTALDELAVACVQKYLPIT